ncbi:hypothetical protein Z951_40135 [Streptomyces sp. PRh5]|nr:hypothetical protein Z951_40135 [Streptomyces sp. PRh5]
MGALATHDDPCAVRIVGKVDHAGQFCDLRPGPQGALLLQRGVPDVLGQSPDCAADRLGDGMSDREEGTDVAGAQGAYVVQECFGSSGAVGADEQVGAVTVGVGDLGEGRIQDGDVIGRCVGSGVARPEQAGESLAGVVQEAQHRVVAEAAFVGGRCLLFLRVAGDQGGVDVQDQAGQVTPTGP